MGLFLNELDLAVSDPTDFPDNTRAPGLRTLDSAFRCAICSEIFDAPMMLRCGHSFCSLCARESLRERHECPHCRSPSEELHLIKNIVLEDLAVYWRSARVTVLSLLRNATKEVNDHERSSRKKRKIILIDDDESSDALNSPIPRGEKQGSDPEDGIIQCPICSRNINLERINEHIDSNCQSFIIRTGNSAPSKSETKSAWNNMFSGSSAKGKGKNPAVEVNNVDKLPKPPYNIYKEKKIRDMLSEHGLSTAGSKEQLVSRHAHYVLIYNSNLDRAEHLRKSITELRRDLKTWEDNLSVKKSGVDDVQGYMKSQKTAFKAHVEAARASMTKQHHDGHEPVAGNSSLTSVPRASPGGSSIDLIDENDPINLEG